MGLRRFGASREPWCAPPESARVGIDIDYVAMLGEAVDEPAQAGGSRRDGSSLLLRHDGRDHVGALFVSSTDDIEQKARNSAVA